MRETSGREGLLFHPLPPADSRTSPRVSGEAAHTVPPRTPPGMRLGVAYKVTVMELYFKMPPAVWSAVVRFRRAYVFVRYGLSQCINVLALP